MIEFSVDMQSLIDDDELECIMLLDENGEHAPMLFFPGAKRKDKKEVYCNNDVWYREDGSEIGVQIKLFDNEDMKEG